jgi:hypothetical protein
LLAMNGIYARLHSMQVQESMAAAE